MIKLKDLYEEITPKHRIFCDMDGVVADFDSRFEEFSGGIPTYQYEKKYGLDKFWAIIDKEGIEFWSKMPWMPDGKELWDYIKPHKPTLLSAPSRQESSREGKRLWVQEHMPGTELILAYASDKQQYAKNHHILIDDRGTNIYQWTQSGGIGILHTSAESTIKKLKEYGL